MPELSSYNREYTLGQPEDNGPSITLEAQHYPELTFAQRQTAHDWQVNLRGVENTAQDTMRWNRWIERFGSRAFLLTAKVGTTQCAVCGRVDDLLKGNFWYTQFPNDSNCRLTCISVDCRNKAQCFNCQGTINTRGEDWKHIARPRRLYAGDTTLYVAFCNECMTDNLRSCLNCGVKWLSAEEDFWSEVFADSCEQCSVDRKRRCLALSRWDTRFDMLLPSTVLTPGVPYLGVELELEMNSRDESLTEYAEQLSPMLDFKAFIKTDGSLSHGLEFVTRPMEYEEQAEFWPPILDELEAHGQPLENCGVHIHVSRWALSPIQLGKILVFLNEPGNADALSFIARRGSGDFCRVYKKKYADIFTTRHNRYETLNLANDKTIEFRLFNSTIKPRFMLSYLQFVLSMLSFTSPGNVGMSGLTKPDAYLAYVAKLGRKTYPELYNRLREGDWL